MAGQGEGPSAAETAATRRSNRNKSKVENNRCRPLFFSRKSVSPLSLFRSFHPPTSGPASTCTAQGQLIQKRRGSRKQRYFSLQFQVEGPQRLASPIMSVWNGKVRPKWAAHADLAEYRLTDYSGRILEKHLILFYSKS